MPSLCEIEDAESVNRQRPFDALVIGGFLAWS